MTAKTFNQPLEDKCLLSTLNSALSPKTKAFPFAIKAFARNAFVYREGDLTKGVYIILEGRIKVGTENPDGKELIKNIYGAGEIFGESVLIGQAKRLDFAKTLETTKIKVIDKMELMTLLQDHPKFGSILMKTLGNRLIETERRLQALVFKSSRTRIVEFLKSLCQKKGQRVGYEFVVRKFMTHQEIAGITATSRQTVTTVLNELRNKNILTFNRRRLLIRNLELLAAESG